MAIILNYPDKCPNCNSKKIQLVQSTAKQHQFKPGLVTCLCKKCHKGWNVELAGNLKKEENIYFIWTPEGPALVSLESEGSSRDPKALKQLSELVGSAMLKAGHPIQSFSHILVPIEVLLSNGQQHVLPAIKELNNGYQNLTEEQLKKKFTEDAMDFQQACLDYVEKREEGKKLAEASKKRKYLKKD